MTSRSRVEANRRNARKSTGPRTVHGRKRASQNAWRHGLAVPPTLDPQWSPHLEELARMIARELGAPQLLALARPIAEARVELNRVHQARQIILTRGNPDQEAANRARAGKRRLKLEDLLDPGDVEIFSDTPMKRRFVKKPLEKTLPLQLTLGEQSLQQVKRLGDLERYEQVALSRYRKAIRAFDAKRRQSASEKVGQGGQS